MCLFKLLGLLTPRVLLIAAFFGGEFFQEAFEDYEAQTFGGLPVVIALIGVVFLPATVLCLLAIKLYSPLEWETWKTVALVLCAIVDLGMIQQSQRRKASAA